MKILGIETSCDETGVAIIDANIKTKELKILSNVVASSLALHSKTGGIIPNIAAREQVKYMIPVIKEALSSTRGVDVQNPAGSIDVIAVTVGPGLIGSLLVGVETARTLAYVLKKPIVPVNHLIGHIYANFIRANPKSEILNPKLNAKRYTLNANIEFPLITLVVSGGHTDLVLMEKHGSIHWLGGTRDDAAGEAFDKIGRLLGIPYPAGAEIEKFAKNGNPKAFSFPRPMIGSKDYDFSFSGLKTAVLRETLKNKNEKFSQRYIQDISASSQQAIIDVLVSKTIKAAQQYKVRSILLGGGVAANQKLRDEFQLKIENLKLKIPFFCPEKRLCTDNAAMIASAAFFNGKQEDWRNIIANPELYFE
ncbi:MAG: tRNA (adenosine(37)-N6)-threonylcarbamoyltransferase complex transferase subunit TsaD [Candidatus Levybacteria bacterium]|nr:tRNA (adenosine(37)-N6)-threonylcarbamoyltransferase complex transferase subunit TsaD [Candidatus Levybacteria bacterium]